MAFKTKIYFLLLVLCVYSVCALATSSKKDPQLQACKRECEVSRGHDEKQRRECISRCEDYYKPRDPKERDEWNIETETDPEKRLQQCQTHCESFRGQERERCRSRCQERYEKEQQGQGRGDSYRSEEQEQEQEQERERDQNPYVFEEEHFQTRSRSEHGKFDVLQRFNKRSKLLRGLENYRLVVLEANPQTFVIPAHVDADRLLFVAKGRATVTQILENKRESHSLECGDILRIRSGVPTYIINTHENEKLYIIKLYRPVNIPDEYEVFFGAGGRNPQSFFNAFSSEILEAAFKTDRSSLERIFKQQSDGVIVKASKQQIESMSQHEEGGSSMWPFPAGEASRGGPFRLFKQKATESNDYGELFEVDSSEYRPLRDLDVQVSFANITKGSMSAPFFNSKATKIAVVIRGNGYFEMACPHVSSSSREQQHGERETSSRSTRAEEEGPRYHKIRSKLEVGTVFIVPAGHPVATVASRSSNLQVVCFEVNAEGNIRYPLAGKGNMIQLMEKEAKELAFNTKAQDVDQVFGKQDLKWFFPGPGQQQQRHHRGGRGTEE
ncbi:hypothetical protein ACFE04_012383 [Oxalis oulophora]